MSSLASLQRRMSHAILDGDIDSMPPLARGPIPLEAAFEVHRNTVLGGLSNALRLNFPTVDILVGEAFFDQMACAYIKAQPPRRARLMGYGDGFPGFLDTYSLVDHLPYLSDVAALDLAIDHALVARDESVRRSVAIEPGISLSLPVSLTGLGLSYPGDLIRAALHSADDQALAAIDLTRQPRFIAIWRTGRQAAVRSLSPPAGVFLARLLANATAEEALAEVFTTTSPHVALPAIQAEVFAAGFARIDHTNSDGQTP